MQVVQRYVDPYQRTTAMVITPTVVKEVRAQFGCDTLPGAALENEGGQGSANAHWEYRWFQVRAVPRWCLDWCCGWSLTVPQLRHMQPITFDVCDVYSV